QTQSCTAVDILAVLIGGKRQMEAAEELLSLYRGSLTEINQATVEELSKVKGIGPQAARRIKAAARLNIVLGPKTAQTVINSPADAAALLIPEMSILEKEHFRVILLANRSQVIAIEEVYIGCVGNISIRPAEILAPAIRRNAPQLIVAHNHPSSDPTPSPGCQCDPGACASLQGDAHYATGPFGHRQWRPVGVPQRARTWFQ